MLNWLRGWLGWPTPPDQYDAIIAQVNVLKLQRGDALVIRFETDIGEEMYKEVRRIFSHMLPGVGLIVLGGDTPVHFEAARPAPPEEPEP